VSKNLSKGKVGKREYLNDTETKELMVLLDKMFLSYVNIPRIRVGKRQELETLITEEALLLAKYLRGERKDWVQDCQIYNLCFLAYFAGSVMVNFVPLPTLLLKSIVPP
jgi:hypothetical protein